MSNECEAALIVGLREIEVSDYPAFDNVNHLTNSKGETFHGLRVASGYCAVEFSDLEKLNDKIKHTKNKFKDETGYEGKLYLTTLVY